MQKKFPCFIVQHSEKEWVIYFHRNEKTYCEIERFFDKKTAVKLAEKEGRKSQFPVYICE